MEFAPLIIALIGLGDIVSLKVERIFFAAGDPGAKSWNESQRAIARKYWWGRCGGEALLLVVPGLLEFFKVLPAWSAVVGLGVYLPIGLWMLRWVRRELPQAVEKARDK